MPQTVESPNVRTGGLVTVAFLKAQLDQGNDHLGIFMPLLFDVLGHLPTQSFTTEDVQEALAARHGVAMPQQTVATLLKRAGKKKYLLRESGRYRRDPLHDLPSSNVAERKSEIEMGQRQLAEALRTHAARRGLVIDSTDAALETLFRFLEIEQVAMLLGSPREPSRESDISQRENAIVAEFLQISIRDDATLLSVLRGMLEGLVLYHAAFLPDLSLASRRFKNLRVVFDSTLVRQALEYEGTAMRTLIRETIDVLKGSGVQCLVFDKTIHEIKRFLAFFENRLATEQGRNSLRPTPMVRHFLTQRYSVSDVREMAALLEREIIAVGFQILAAPSRLRDHTAGEESLAKRLADPTSKDALEPRVVHDVDCVAAILTLRHGHRSASIDDAGVVFATASPLVIRNVRLWWEEDEHETGIEPVVHIRALSNLAWLKKPSLCSDFKIRELVALCSAALRPTQPTWERFLRHLQTLQKSQRLNSDEVTAILVSAMSDSLLKDAEIEEDDLSDIDAVTMDEIVDRVTRTYAANAEQRVQAVTSEYQGKFEELEEKSRQAVARAAEVERAAAEGQRRRSLFVEGRSRKWARRVTLVLKWIVCGLVMLGAGALISGHPFHSGWVGLVIGVGFVCFVALELFGILHHVSELQASTELHLTRRFRDWLSGSLQGVGECTGPD